MSERLPLPPSPDALFAPPGVGRTAIIRRFHTVVRVPAAASGGGAAVLEHTLEPGCVAMPLHRHVATEVIHVLAGALTVQVGNDVRPAPAGTSVVVPGDIWHTFWVDVNEMRPARFLAVVAPGGMDEYYQDVATHIPPPDTRRGLNIDAVLEASARHGVEVDMLSLYDLIERYGLALA
jgi:quercetin dioxygenase-like cupin family protein